MAQIRSRAVAQFKISNIVKRLIIVDKQGRITEYHK